MTDPMPRGRPDPDPTVLTTDALNREVAYLKEKIKDSDDAIRELMLEKFQGVEELFKIVESHRVEQKADTQENINKAFSANTDAIGNVEKIQAIANDRITALEASKQGGVDMRVAMLAIAGFAITVFTVLAANGVFNR